MTSTDAIDILNDLLAYEKQSIVPRVRESTVFVSWASAEDKRTMDRLIQEQQEHEAWLVQAIIDLGGDPLPAWADIRTADMHFVEVHSLLPRLLNDAHRIVAAYEAAAAIVGTNPIASETVSRILERTRKHVDQLSALTRRVLPNH